MKEEEKVNDKNRYQLRGTWNDKRMYFSMSSQTHVFEIERIGLNIKDNIQKRRCIIEIKTAVNVTQEQMHDIKERKKCTDSPCLRKDA